MHQMVLGNDILLLERLTNLDKVANRRIIAGSFPLPFKGADCSPIRAVAFVEDQGLGAADLEGGPAAICLKV